MNSFLFFIFALEGLVVGLKIPQIAIKIIKYKKREVKKDSFIFYKVSYIGTIIANTIAWIFSGSFTDNIFIGLLFAVQITLGIIIIYIDINIRIIPNELVLTMILLGIIFQISNYSPKALIGAIISMLAMMLVFTTVAAFVGFGKVGAGDIKLAGAMGLSLGYPTIITGIGIMAFALLIFILTGLTLKKLYLSTMLPFAPFMIVGYVSALIFLLF